MTKLFSFLSSAFVLVGVASAHAETPWINVAAVQRAAMQTAQTKAGINWKVGDKSVYSLDLAGLIKGTSTSFVREATDTDLWQEQDMDLGVAGKQKIEIHMERATGKILQLLVNGQAQQPPAATDMTVEDMKEDHITVKAGSFDCVYVKIKQNSSNQESEAWMNPQAIPMEGMLKTIAPMQFGTITEELQSFSFGN